jgi:nitrate/TMAO reductase-like tetraheme cytochrome c subunit
MSSYHGIASRLGDVTVANCASCHGVHDIKPSSDPTSSINPRNLTKTCGKCHPGSSKQFVSHKIHVEKVEQESLGASLAKKFYSIFIPSLVGFFVIFIGVELYGSIRRKRGEDSS